MESLMFVGLLALAGVAGWLWQKVRSLKAQAFFSRLYDQERAVRDHIRRQGLDAVARMRQAGGRFPR